MYRIILLLRVTPLQQDNFIFSTCIVQVEPRPTSYCIFSFLMIYFCLVTRNTYILIMSIDVKRKTRVFMEFFVSQDRST